MVADLLDQIVNSFFQIQSLQLLIFFMDDQEFVAYLNYVLSFLLNHCLFRFIILLHLISSFSISRSLLVLNVYVSIESAECILLSSFDLKIILLTSSVKTLRFSLLNLYCCVFNIDLLSFINSLWFSLILPMSIFFLYNKRF